MDSASVGMTPLMHASQEGHTDCVRLLLLARASVCSEDEDGMSALHFAACSASLDVAAALMWAGAYAAAVDRSGVSVMGHLPPEVHHDNTEIRRWRATLGLVGHSWSGLGDGITKEILSH